MTTNTQFTAHSCVGGGNLGTLCKDASFQIKTLPLSTFREILEVLRVEWRI